MLDAMGMVWSQNPNCADPGESIVRANIHQGRLYEGNLSFDACSPANGINSEFVGTYVLGA